MKRFVCFLLVIFSVVASAIGKPPVKGYAIIDVTVIPMTRDTIMRQQVVLVEGERIKTIANRNEIKIPKGYTTIDGSGKFLVPGFFDMHAHFFYEQGDNVNTCEHELKLMLANGLTTARIQCGDPVYLEARKNVSEKKWTGPKLFVASPQVVGVPMGSGKIFAAVCQTPEQGKAAVRQFKAEGYDAVKITFGVSMEVFDAIAKTAATEKIKLTGHVGPRVKLPAALAVREQNEHMDEFIDVLLPDTSYNHGESVSDMNLWRKRAWETVPFLDEGKIPTLVSMVRDANIYVTPTNYFFFSFFGRTIDEEVATKAKDWQYVPVVLKAEAQRVRQHYQKNLPLESSRMRYIELRKKITYELWQAGVKLMAGSDSPQWYSAPGFALHDELQTFVECGLTPYAALEAATINPATYLEINNDVGTVEAGKIADLVLLERNPLENIANTRLIGGVFAKGKYFDNAGVKKLLEESKVLGN